MNKLNNLQMSDYTEKKVCNKTKDGKDIKIDTVAPNECTLSYMVTNSAGDYLSSPKLVLTAKDDESGISKVVWSNGRSESVTGAAGQSVTSNLDINETGKYIATVYDKAGNAKSCGINITSLQSNEDDMISDLQNQIKELKIDGIFPYIGLEPNVEMFGAQLKQDKNGFIITNEFMETNIKGVYAIGDVRNTPLRQVITAVSDGAIASVEAAKYLMNLENTAIRK